MHGHRPGRQSSDMLYNYPGRMAADMDEEFDRVGRSPNFCAIKESSGDINHRPSSTVTISYLLACVMVDQAGSCLVRKWVCAGSNFARGLYYALASWRSTGFCRGEDYVGAAPLVPAGTGWSFSHQAPLACVIFRGPLAAAETAEKGQCGNAEMMKPVTTIAAIEEAAISELLTQANTPPLSDLPFPDLSPVAVIAPRNRVF